MGLQEKTRGKGKLYEDVFMVLLRRAMRRTQLSQEGKWFLSQSIAILRDILKARPSVEKLWISLLPHI